MPPIVIEEKTYSSQVTTVRPRGTRLMCPKKNRVSRNRLSWGLLLFSKVSKFKKNSGP